MKLHHTQRSGLWKTLLVLALALIVADAPARATLLYSGVDLKSAGRTTQWALFALSGGVTITDTTSQGAAFGGPAVISTDGALEGAKIGAAGGGSVTLSGTTKVVGTAYIRRYGVLRKSGTASISSTAYAGGLAPQDAANDSAMDQVVADANAASTAASLLANNTVGLMISDGTWSGAYSTVNQNTGFSLTAPDGAHIVLHLNDFVLTNGAELKLYGGATTTYVINVANNFSLLGGKVSLFGGIEASNVLFNITGLGADLSLTSASQFNGFILANKRTVNVSGLSKVSGTIIADKVNISGGSRIVKPTYNSP